MKIINIEGWPAAGKTALWGLLDGSKYIFVDPIHNYSHYASLGVSNSITVREFRKLLSLTEYFKLEQYSISKEFPISYGVDKNRNYNFNFDFKKFDEEFRDSCVNDVQINSKDFLNKFITKYISNYQRNKPYQKYFATMSNYFEYKKFCNSNIFLDSKTIVVTRSAVEIIASRVGRTARDVDGNSPDVFAPKFLPLLLSSEIEEINTFNYFYNKLQNRFPENVLVITIEELIYQKKCTMNKVCDFLEIEFEDIFLYASRDGIHIEDDNFSLTKKINDKSEDILNKYQICLISFIELIWRVHKKPVSIFNPLSLFRFFYLKYKGLR